MSAATAYGPGRAPVVLLVVAALGIAAATLIGWFVRGAGDGKEQALLTDADIAFAQQMSVHHQQALTMVALLGPQPAPEVAAAAEQIRVSQWREIGTLTGWLELLGAPLQPPPGTGHGAHHSSGPTMAGMASNAELTRLHNAVGADRDVLFLQLMIRHHQGGIEMAATAVDTTTTPAVRARALAMVNGQQQEISAMSVLLHQRGAAALPYP